MCGIGGIRRFNTDDPITIDEVCLLATALEKRGLDATGLAAMVGNKLHVVKLDDQAWKFLANKKVQQWMEEYIPTATTVLVHTRAATGSAWPSKMENNHPLCAGKSAVVHNGMISNDDFLFRDLKLERKAETDTDIIRAIVDEEGFTEKAIRVLSRISGSVAAGILNPEMPEHVLLLKSGSPLECGMSMTKLYWASEKHAIYTAARTPVLRFGLWGQATRADVAFATMPGDTAWLIGPGGLEWHQSFKSAVYASHTGGDRNFYGRWAENRKRWAEDKDKAVKVRYTCPKCGLVLEVPPDLANKWMGKCAKCKEKMIKQPEVN